MFFEILVSDVVVETTNGGFSFITSIFNRASFVKKFVDLNRQKRHEDLTIPPRQAFAVTEASISCINLVLVSTVFKRKSFESCCGSNRGEFLSFVEISVLQPSDDKV